MTLVALMSYIYYIYDISILRVNDLNNVQKFVLTFNTIFFIKDLASQVFPLKDIYKELIFSHVLAYEF
jgi:hypothetical protein